MSTRTERIAAAAAVIMVAAALIVGLREGSTRGLQSAETAVKETAAHDERVLGWVVERNPQATIREFHGFARMLIEESSAAGVDYRLVMAIIDKESQFNPRAVGRAGEIGLMQVIPATAQIVAQAKKISYDAPSPRRADGTYADLGSLGDPKVNVRIGLAYLRDQVTKFGTTPTALRAYNRGDANATARRPGDRYAEDVAFRMVAIVHRLPR